jgi:hypothetical protein
MADTKRAEILNEAIALVHGQREADYGDAWHSFNRIAERWSQSLEPSDGGFVAPYHVAMAMADLKLARLQNGYHKDSILDAICYLALAYEMHDMQIQMQGDV